MVSCDDRHSLFGCNNQIRTVQRVLKHGAGPDKGAVLAKSGGRTSERAAIQREERLTPANDIAMTIGLRVGEPLRRLMLLLRRLVCVVGL